MRTHSGEPQNALHFTSIILSHHAGRWKYLLYLVLLHHFVFHHPLTAIHIITSWLSITFYREDGHSYQIWLLLTKISIILCTVTSLTYMYPASHPQPQAYLHFITLYGLRLLHHTQAHTCTQPEVLSHGKSFTVNNILI